MNYHCEWRWLVGELSISRRKYVVIFITKVLLADSDKTRHNYQTKLPPCSETINKNCLNDLIMTLKMISTQVVETPVLTNSVLSKDYTIPVDQPTINIDFTRFRPFTVLKRF